MNDVGSFIALGQILLASAGAEILPAHPHECAVSWWLGLIKDHLTHMPVSRLLAMVKWVPGPLISYPVS